MSVVYVLSLFPALRIISGEMVCVSLRSDSDANVTDSTRASILSASEISDWDGAV